MTLKRNKISVIGGGFTGATAAFLLAQKINQNLTNLSNLQEPKMVDHNWTKNIKMHSKKLNANLAIIKHLKDTHGWND